MGLNASAKNLVTHLDQLHLVFLVISTALVLDSKCSVAALHPSVEHGRHSILGFALRRVWAHLCFVDSTLDGN